jgi:Tol biopolymer transport system component
MRKHIFIGMLAAVLSLAACAAGSPGAPTIPTITPAAPAVSPADLKLSGRLIYTGAAESISQYDLAANQISVLFEAPRNGFVTGEAVSPDGSQVVFSYAPPPKGSAQLGYSDLYKMPLQKSAAPGPLLEGSAKQEVYSYPSWSPDGKYLYFGHTLAAGGDGSQDGPRIERIVYLDGPPEVIQKGASYPRLSPDGSKLVYITFKPDLSGNEIFVANPDGSGATRIVPQTGFTAIDSPIFSPDGRSIVFSAVGNLPTSYAPDILSRWLGVQVAYAHNIPSDLWRVPVGGGKPERLTHVGCTGLFAGYSPDGRFMAFVCDAGFFVMNPDGSNLGLINPTGGLGMMEWIR